MKCYNEVESATLLFLFLSQQESQKSHLLALDSRLMRATRFTPVPMLGIFAGFAQAKNTV
jgi:hypothetical protein